MLTLETEMCLALWVMILGSAFKLLEPFTQFLKEKEVKAITLDQWENLLEVLKICGDSIVNYDDMGSCKFGSAEKE